MWPLILCFGVVFFKMADVKDAKTIIPSSSWKRALHNFLGLIIIIISLPSLYFENSSKNTQNYMNFWRPYSNGFVGKLLLSNLHHFFLEFILLIQISHSSCQIAENIFYKAVDDIVYKKKCIKIMNRFWQKIDCP